MNPTLRRRIAAVLLAASIVCWPLTQLTLATEEPPFVLGLSWAAIILTLVDITLTTDVRKQADDDEAA